MPCPEFLGTGGKNVAASVQRVGCEETHRRCAKAPVRAHGEIALLAIAFQFGIEHGYAIANLDRKARDGKSAIPESMIVFINRDGQSYAAPCRHPEFLPPKSRRHQRK